MKNWLRNHKELIIFILYSCVTFSLLFFHENWRDEAQAWLIARDCGFSELVDVMKYEGHFLLWYLILMPFAKMGLPYFTTNLISWFITDIAVWILLNKAPFSFGKKVLLAFTSPLLYLFPIISRCYCLIPLAIVIMSIFYKERKEKPFRYLISIVFLLNTHIIMAGMAGIAVLDFLIEIYKRWNGFSEKEQKKIIFSIVIALILMAVSVYPLLGCLATNKQISFNEKLTLKFSEIFFYYPTKIVSVFYIILGSMPSSNRIVFGIVGITLLYEVKADPLTWFKIWVCIVWQCFVYSNAVGPSFQMAATVFFIILYYKWIQTFETSYITSNIPAFHKKLCWTSLLLLNIIGGVLFLKFYEIPDNFSNSYEVAEYANNNLYDNSIITCGPHMEFVSSVIPYIHKNKKIRFYSISGKRYFSYAIWDNLNNKNITFEDIRELKKTFRDDEKLYYLLYKGRRIYSNRELEKTLINSLIEKGVLKKLYASDDNSITSENYIIYEVDQNKI